MKKILKKSLSTLYNSFNLKNIPSNTTIMIKDLISLKLQRDPPSPNLLKQFKIMEQMIRDIFPLLRDDLKFIEDEILSLNGCDESFVLKTNWFIQQQFKETIRRNTENIITEKIVKIGEQLFKFLFEENPSTDTLIVIVATGLIIEKLLFPNALIYLAPPLTYAVIKYLLHSSTLSHFRFN